MRKYVDGVSYSYVHLYHNSTFDICLYVYIYITVSIEYRKCVANAFDNLHFKYKKLI